MNSRSSLKAVLTAIIIGLTLGPFVFNPNALAQKKVQTDTELWRRTPPRPAPPSPYTIPAAREAKLANGLTIVLIEDRRTPLVSIRAGVRVGTVDDPVGQPGLAEATADLLIEGAGSRNAEELAREVESLGGRIETEASDDYTEIEIGVVAENAEKMLEISADVVMRPSFAEKEVALYKSNRVQNLILQRQEPAFLVSEHFNRILFGAHPYGISAPTPESIEAMTREKVESFHKAHYSPEGTVWVIAGDFDAAKMEAKVRGVLGSWRVASPPARSFPATPARTQRRIYLMNRPGSDQADFRIGNLALSRAHPDYYALLVANTILGGGTSSRLFLGIRERKGYAYDVSSNISAPKQQGTFFAASVTRNEVTIAAIREMLAEFTRMRNLKVTPADLRNAKNYLTGVFSLTLSTQGGLAGGILHSRMLDLPANTLESHRARIEAVTADQVQQAAMKYMLTDRTAIVVVGDAATLKPQLQTLGPVEVVDIEGKPQVKAARTAASK